MIKPHSCDFPQPVILESPTCCVCVSCADPQTQPGAGSLAATTLQQTPSDPPRTILEAYLALDQLLPPVQDSAQARLPHCSVLGPPDLEPHSSLTIAGFNHTTVDRTGLLSLPPVPPTHPINPHGSRIPLLRVQPRLCPLTFSTLFQ